MSKILSNLEQSLGSSITPEAQKLRKTDVLRVKNPVKRAGAFALHELATRRPDIARRILFGNHESLGLEYAGSGAEYTVFRRGTDVIKIHRESVGLDEKSREKLAFRINEEHTEMASFMGAVVVRQTTFIDKHPRNPRRRAIQASQPFIDFTSLDFFIYREQGIDRSELAKKCDLFPGLKAELCEFTVTSRAMHRDLGLLPDTCGYANLVVSVAPAPHLYLIDGQPITDRHTTSQDVVLGHLDALDFALESVAS